MTRTELLEGQRTLHLILTSAHNILRVEILLEFVILSSRFLYGAWSLWLWFSQVRLYDIAAQRRPVLAFDYGESPIKTVTEDQDGYSVYVGTGGGDLGCFDMRTGKQCMATRMAFIVLGENFSLTSCSLFTLHQHRLKAHRFSTFAGDYVFSERRGSFDLIYQK